jgi:Tfp pilus assembly PilM family ATPase
MFRFLKNDTCPIGVDMSNDALKLVQLANNGKAVSLIAGSSEALPGDIKPGSGSWQRWAIEAIKKLTTDGIFQGRDVIAAMPAGEVFIDLIKAPAQPKTKKKTRQAPKTIDGELQQALFSKVRQSLPFDADKAMIKYIATEQNNVLAIAAEREKIDRHLAIYEKANLQIKSIGVWPAAMANTYVTFFGRRKTDVEAIVMLLDIEADRSNVVICRHKNLLFARSIPIGAKQLNDEKVLTRLVLELTGCRRYFGSMYREAKIERMIFLSGGVVKTNICTTIAKQLETPAQMGDCLAAVEITDPAGLGIDRRQSRLNWATAFGLSLMGEKRKPYLEYNMRYEFGRLKKCLT